ncbi:MAG: DUF814 domain-containing protein [Candidatus Eisenbacteria bacterium]|nr:DUF814 domain-containing protein [Candidatus Eisenbacteria bacterium]
MNRAGLDNLMSELAPRLTGRRVTRIKAPADGTTVLELAGSPGGSLVVFTDQALPLLFLEQDDAVPGEGDAPPHLRSLKGGEIVSAGLGPGGPSAAFVLRRRDPVGIETDVGLVVDLGRRPSLSLDPSGRVEPEEPHADDPTGASVSWWRDEAGRLHVRIGRSPHEKAAEKRTFDTWNEAARFAYREHAATILDDRRRKTVLRALRRRLKRKRRAVERVRRGLSRAERTDEFRHKGQLLLARKGDFRRGERLQKLVDYDGDSVVEIEVDPRRSAVDNAESYFRRARKAERVAQRSPARLRELEREIEAIEKQIEATEEATGRTLRKLEDRHAARPAKGNRAGGDEERIRFRSYVVTGGWEVLVGKSNRDNDLLTQRVAAPSDLWFHARQAPGSHVVLRRAGRKDEPDRRAILETAAIAAYHSKAGKSSKVAVLYTEKRHVRKPKGAKPGLVSVSREEVVLVRPQLPEPTGGPDG